MNRNEITVIDKLQFGDRFYKSTDRKKSVRVKVAHASKKSKFRTFKNWSCDASIFDHQTLPHPHKERLYSAHNPDMQVVFLRHN